MKRGLLTLALAASMVPFAAFAEGDGIYDVARPGAGCNCHAYGPSTMPGGLPSPTQVQLFVDDLPLASFTGYAPGSTHKLTVWVVGPLPFAGFNLEASAGTLAAVGTAAQAVNLNECGRMERQTACAGSACQVVLDDACPVYDVRNAACRKCAYADLNDPSKCRPCDAGAIVDVQATHAAKNPLPFFELEWTAPSEATDVEFYLAGNKVSGAGGNFGTSVAVWNFADPNPLLIHPAPQ